MAISRWAALLAAVVALFGSSQAKAQIVGDVIQGQFVNINDTIGRTGYQTQPGGVLDTAGSTWNRVFGNYGSTDLYSDDSGENPLPLSLVTATGASTVVTFNATLQSADAQGVNSVGSPNYNGFGIGPTPSWSLMNNYAYSKTTSSNKNTFSFSGLSAGVYNFYAYTTGDNDSNGRQLAMEVEGTTKTSDPIINADTVNTFILNQNYLLFSNITVGVGGTISGTWWSPSGNEADWNGFQLQQVQAVPEPGSMILTGLALAGMGGAAWRRRKGKTAPVETPEASA